MALDYDTFSRPDFDPNDYANAILAGDPYPAQPLKTPLPRTPKSGALEPAKEDISVVLTKLNLGIDDVTKQLKSVVRVFCQGCECLTDEEELLHV